MKTFCWTVVMPVKYAFDDYISKYVYNFCDEDVVIDERKPHQENLR
jgi:hypothetical protein